MAKDTGSYIPPSLPPPDPGDGPITSPTVEITEPWTPPDLPVYDFPYLPATPTSFPSKQDVNDVAENADVRFMTYGASRKPIPIILGKDRTGGIISMIRVEGNYLYMRVIWCVGKVKSCTVLNRDGTAFNGSVVTYLGTTSQGIDPWLASVEAGYDDDLVITRDNVSFGLCYSVIRVKTKWDEHVGWPTFIAEIEGLEDIWDPRLDGGAGDYAYTNTAGLLLNWLITDPVHGLGQLSDDTSLDAMADYHEGILDDGAGYTEKRNTFGLTISKRNDIVKYIEAARGLSRCMLVNRGGTYHYVLDKTRSSSGTIASSSIIPGSMQPKPLDIRNAPNVVIIMYTNMKNDEWRDGQVEVVSPEVASGAERRRELVLNMPSVQSRTLAKRIGIERLNKARLTTFEVAFTVLDDGLKIEEGDVWAVDEPEIAGSQSINVLAKVLVAPGQFTIIGDNYDADIYSDEIADNSDFQWTDGSDHPLAPPIPTGLIIIDDPLELSNGTWTTYLDLEWDDPEYTYLREYYVEVKLGSRTVYTHRTDKNFITVGPVNDGLTYTINVSIISTAFIKGSPLSDDHIPSPTIPTPDWGVNGAIDAVEVGGEIRLKVLVEPDDLDLQGYEWRFLSFEDNLFPDGWNVDSTQAANWAVVGGGGSITANSDGHLVFTAGSTSLQTFKDTVIGELANLDYTGGIKLIASIEIVDVSGGTGNEVIHLGDDSVNTEANSQALSVSGVGFAYAELSGSYSSAPTDIRIWIEDSQASAQIEVKYAVFYMDMQDWDRASLIDRTPMLNMVTNELPAGFYRVYCKAFDSYVTSTYPNGQYSADIKALTVEVTLDVDVFFLGELDVGKPLTTDVNLFNFTLGRSGQTEYWVPTSDTAAGTLFSADPLGSNYPNPADSYGLSGIAIQFGTSVYFFDADVNATITRKASMRIFPEVGAVGAQSYTCYSRKATPTTWIFESREVANLIGAQFLIWIATTAGDYVRIEKPNMKLLANAVPRNEQFEGTSLASGATTITLDKVYTFVKDISVEIVDDSGDPLTHVIDEITMGDPASFDLYIYNTDTGVQVAADYRGHFEGI